MSCPLCGSEECNHTPEQQREAALRQYIQELDQDGESFGHEEDYYINNDFNPGEMEEH